jgi:plasmid stability protein
MVSLSIRKLDQKTYDALRQKAAGHGISMEEEVRRLISVAVAAPEKISDSFRKRFGTKNGVELDLSTPRDPHDPLAFHE